jgi:hypothetical protein
VVKTAVKNGTAIFREALIQAATLGPGPIVPQHVKEMWGAARSIKDDVRALVLADRTNDGVRLQAVKFLEHVILLFHGREWGSGVVSHNHATLSMDELATEADNLLGVLLECLKPEVCAKQAGTVTLVMIGAASNISQKLPIYLDFVLPSLLELAAVNTADTAGSAAAASTGKELRSALLLMLKSGLQEVEPFKDELTKTLRDLGAGEQVDSWVKQSERAAAKRKEREAREEEGEGGKRQRTDGGGGGEFSGSGGGGGGGGWDSSGHAAPQQIAMTDPGLLAQVLSTVATLAVSDRTMLNAFVTQLAPEVLADVVLSNIFHLSAVGGRVMIDVQAGAGVGVEGFLDAALSVRDRGGGPLPGHGPGAGSAEAAARSSAGVMSTGRVSSDVDLMDLSGDKDDDEDEGAAAAAAAAARAASGAGAEAGAGVGVGAGGVRAGAGKAAPPAPPRTPVAPFELTVRAMSGSQRRKQSSAALARIVQAADPSGAVASMGGAELQAALLTRLAASSVASATAAEGIHATGPVGGALPGSGSRSEGGGVGGEGGAGVGAGSLLAMAGAGVGAGAGGGDGTTAGPLMEYLVSALPDPVAHGVAMRLLGAMFVNETMLSSSSQEEEKSSKAGAEEDVVGAGAYARTLMTLAVGLVESESMARAKHLPRLLLDSPSLPPPVLRLLRALCLLPLPPLSGDGGISGGVQGKGEGKGKGEVVGSSTGRGACDRHGFVVHDVKEEGTSVTTVSWGGRALPKSGEAVTLALSTLRDLIFDRPTARGACLEIVLECAVHPDESVRGRAIRLVANKLHPVGHLAAGIEVFAMHHLGEAAAAGGGELAAAKALAAKAAASMMREAAAKVAATAAKAAKAAALKAEAEGREVVTPAAAADDAVVAMDEGGEEGGAGGEGQAEGGEGEAAEAAAAAAAEAEAAAERVKAAAAEAEARINAAAAAAAIATTARHLLLFCALCTRKHSLLPLLFDAYAKLPEALRPAVLNNASFDGLVRAVGLMSEPLVAAIAAPPKGAETLAKRAVEVLAEVGLCTFNAVDPQLESAWFPAL